MDWNNAPNIMMMVFYRFNETRARISNHVYGLCDAIPYSHANSRDGLSGPPLFGYGYEITGNRCMDSIWLSMLEYKID